LNSKAINESQGLVLVVGMGEVGQPLYRILNRSYECVGVDLEPAEIDRPCAVMHICYPFSIEDYIGTTLRYIDRYQPALTIINSTVSPGTTRKVQEGAGNRPIAYSPVRGKHIRMEDDMLKYKKFVASSQDEALRQAVDHFERAGLKTATFGTPEVAELAKLLETTYLGVLVAWTQEMERLAAAYGGSFEEVNAFVREIDFLPSHMFPGEIGGHCVLPNIAILRSAMDSPFFDAVLEANDHKKLRHAAVAAR
jgi:UDP-N-acetyl-D-mannosaminuronate dehydrogenase